ncbi:MAG: tetratricopeptide repeat protein [Hydrotalea sp. AMD]|uniref:tetratricopeptide repeat protein n=1 Tax=Hydrotalea sp. AMD TaxID=2501297 RepID=UPI000943A6C9|nr:tetratricopeptide repeat protein [Hydrotalea sp. AMD]RWZ90361.1 MAG: tetratricopeptide repeat protein [Hydrotalea sp. AMD]
MKQIIFFILLNFANTIAMSQTDKKVFLKEQGNHSLKNRNYDEAINYYLQSLAIDANYTDAIYNLGIAYAKKEDWDKSIYYFTKYIERDKNYKEAWYNRGFAYTNKGMFREALNDYKQALIIDPHFYKAKYNYEYISRKINKQ